MTQKPREGLTSQDILVGTGGDILTTFSHPDRKVESPDVLCDSNLNLHQQPHCRCVLKSATRWLMDDNANNGIQVEVRTMSEAAPYICTQPASPTVKLSFL